MIKKLMINCKDATLMSSMSEDSKLSFSDLLKFKMHITLCKVCAKFDSQVKLIIETLERIDSDVNLTKEEKEAIKKKL
ncbi:MAG: hypothetical protein IAE98_12045, partial [Candidatus Kapabacteria bacterium]|nr:hypothetical protein [Candidatus Kapabacteria bacterium]